MCEGSDARLEYMREVGAVEGKEESSLLSRAVFLKLCQVFVTSRSFAEPFDGVCL